MDWSDFEGPIERMSKQMIDIALGRSDHPAASAEGNASALSVYAG
jgi:hypothetical protein